MAFTRREFLAGLTGSAAWPLAGHSLQPMLLVVGFPYGGSVEDTARFATAFHKGPGEIG
jgi:hypothetical protein